MVLITERKHKVNDKYHRMKYSNTTKLLQSFLPSKLFFSSNVFVAISVVLCIATGSSSDMEYLSQGKRVKRRESESTLVQALLIYYLYF